MLRGEGVSAAELAAASERLPAALAAPGAQFDLAVEFVNPSLDANETRVAAQDRASADALSRLP